MCSRMFLFIHLTTQEEKKRSRSSLGSPEEDKKTQNTNEERVKENQLRRKLLLDEPKCNIEKGQITHSIFIHNQIGNSNKSEYEVT